jgi:malate dehydrogenase (oxaloacetate-decarboxylating)(NADP+)
VRYLGPTFGGINLEDIRSPDCFIIEQQLREMMDIPVFHDDQHGTAIIVTAGLINAADITGRKLSEMKVVLNGPGAAGIATLELIKAMGVRPENCLAVDKVGVLSRDRTDLNQWQSAHAVVTKKRTLAEALVGADVLIGVSAKGAVTQEMVKSMAKAPIIFAMANPDPEITPEEVKAVRPDAIVATGRSDYPNQVNNVLCFPFIFRGALDVGATTITREMEIAAVQAIADLARQEQSDIVAAAYGGLEDLAFGPEYLIPKPFDPRLIVKIAPAVARAAMQSGVATRPIADLDAYAQRLLQFVYHSGSLMQPIFSAARNAPAQSNRIVYAEGEDERVLRAVQIAVDEKLVTPILIGRPAVIERAIKLHGLRIRIGEHLTVVNPDHDQRYREYWQEYHHLTRRSGVTAQYAKLEMRRRTTLIAAMLLRKGEADGLICGMISATARHLRYIDQVIGHPKGVRVYGTMTGLILPGRQLFIVDTHVNLDPSAEELAEITGLAAAQLCAFGLKPKVALLSHSNFGSSNAPSALKMRAALALLHERLPELEVDGEMHGDCALDETARRANLPDSTLQGSANLLVCPNLDSANIAYNLLKSAAGHNVAIGPMLLGCAAPAHILTPAATVRRIVNMTALTVTEAQRPGEGQVP